MPACTRLDHKGVPSLAWAYRLGTVGMRWSLPCTLDDMADDAVALLDALSLPSAHLSGASMGGMISQLIAIRYPQRALPLTSIMFTTGNMRLPKSDAETL